MRVFVDSHLPVNCIAFSPDGKFLAAAGEETKVRIYDLTASSQITELIDHSSAITSVAWNSNGTLLSSGCSDGTVRIYSLVKQNTKST